MAYTYQAGERKVRPGVYQRISKRESNNAAGALNGVVAFAMAASWGPVDKVTAHETASSIRATYGSGASVDAACAIIAAGASIVYIKRLNGANGTEGSKVNVEIGSNVTMEAKYPSSRSFTVNVKEKIGDSAKKQVVITEGTALLETMEFEANGTDESAAFMEAMKGSAYAIVTKCEAGPIITGEFVMTGKDPENTAADYADAFYALEPFNYNVLAADSIDADVWANLCAYEEESFDNGKLIMVVGGDTPATDIADRCSAAAACNSERCVYFGSSWQDANGEIVEGVKAIAHVAGVIAATPANRSIVHSIIAGAVDIPEKLTNAQYTNAIQNGLLLLSSGPDGQIWFDSGINTLISPAENQDDGWKKIRRVKTRYELMDRIDRTLAPKVGKINCDTDGISYIIQSAMGIIKSMIAEGKISAGSFYEDPENPHAGDSAWFIIECDDIDSLEKIYLHYQFRYSAN